MLLLESIKFVPKVCLVTIVFCLCVKPRIAKSLIQNKPYLRSVETTADTQLKNKIPKSSFVSFCVKRKLYHCLLHQLRGFVYVKRDRVGVKYITKIKNKEEHISTIINKVTQHKTLILIY